MHASITATSRPPFVASARKCASRSTPITFVRLEPLARAKRHLSNAPGERVDTRVVEAIFRLEPGALPVGVGQLVDVFIEAAPRNRALAAR